MKNNKKTATVRLAALFLLVVHLLALTAFASGSGTILDVQVWTEGALTPATQTKGDGTLTVTSTNAPGDWWKVKVELPRVTEAGKTYDTTFVFTSNATGTIKYSANDATYLNSNEYNVQNGEKTTLLAQETQQDVVTTGDEFTLDVEMGFTGSSEVIE